MPLSLNDDLAEMLSNDDHGVVCTYNGRVIDVIFNKEFYDQDVGTAGISSSEPVIYARAIDVPNLEVDSFVTIDGINYKVAHKEPDGQGLVRILLNG